jgi:hypothetical protein
VQQGLALEADAQELLQIQQVNVACVCRRVLDS